ncbi:MAG: hypothetical protein COS58_00605 [Candidatus Tagabacteria bacterium CG03_land_8_20_14_0_80_41_22]|uniref:Uncharacterized protein n=1 Tax=Candidatus Tagabacteria bacterium CG03_land_8_20_14_0_80_41_22 TaxID=1975020 RepID=A0A2M7B9J5_9BACT|nr:MAG: hypothetical protein COS58_00605 [Candidatus Tagabacteria bacterium CG03_land_8_20_14_0_80_41_22]
MKFIIPFIITAIGQVFWLWSRGGRLPIWPREADELDQMIYRPFASPILFSIGAVLTVYGLYKSYFVEWWMLLISFFGGALLAKIIYILIIRRFIE